jgi:hypothetical protein
MELRPEYAGDIPIPDKATTVEKPADPGFTIFDLSHVDPENLQE